MTKPSASGRCLCGAVAFEIEGPLSPPSLCHCGMCRRIHGAPGAFTSAPTKAYRISGEENVKWYASSHDAERGFCRVCGSKLFWREQGGDTLDVTLGALDRPSGLRLDKHIWTAHQGDYYAIGDDGVARYADSSSDGPAIAPVPGPDSGPRKSFHTGRCDCGAVTYKVAGNMRDVVVCHCGQCLRMAGHAPGFSAARTAELTVAGGDALSWYRASPEARRGFCSRCGSTLFWAREGADRVSITAGSLDAPTGLKTVRHIFVADKGDWYEIADGVHQSPGTMQGDPVAF
jgi:hypothetical protein